MQHYNIVKKNFSKYYITERVKNSFVLIYMYNVVGLPYLADLLQYVMQNATVTVKIRSFMMLQYNTVFCCVASNVCSNFIFFGHIFR
jgi:cobalamin biosynthesis Co2+ chelatase CbiK